MNSFYTFAVELGYTDRMSRFFMVALILVMLTPSLACGMPVRFDPLAARAMAGCHEPDPAVRGGVMLIKDCLAVDLHGAAESFAPVAPDGLPDVVAWGDFSWLASAWPEVRSLPVARGPPPDFFLSRSAYSLILRTFGRLRI